ncbi:hypothetical protein A9972_16930 [Pseudomonas sp. UME83]|uniref:hypothetical protein n=1 Tax=Pseudomonas sp. (strain M1) TaxID=95619 RepID=UPI0003E59A88|nr:MULTISPECIES: hypothetical protein [unclassified Pseudomonas]MBB1605654.1 hypothetical protein [Pseudomonas sp. UMC76]MBB1639723.1 hypothetical protein [Pseudomonas sp. UME83]UNY92366.1 hypothetical protein MRY70_10135 [Pseudomonas sp. M1]
MMTATAATTRGSNAPCNQCQTTQYPGQRPLIAALRHQQRFDRVDLAVAGEDRAFFIGLGDPVVAITAVEYQIAARLARSPEETLDDDGLAVQGLDHQGIAFAGHADDLLLAQCQLHDGGCAKGQVSLVDLGGRVGSLVDYNDCFSHDGPRNSAVMGMQMGVAIVIPDHKGSADRQVCGPSSTTGFDDSSLRPASEGRLIGGGKILGIDRRKADGACRCVLCTGRGGTPWIRLRSIRRKIPY